MVTQRARGGEAGGWPAAVGAGRQMGKALATAPGRRAGGGRAGARGDNRRLFALSLSSRVPHKYRVDDRDSN